MVRVESEAGSVGVSLKWSNYLWQNLEEGCGLKARLGAWWCPFNGVTIYGKIWKKGAG